MEHEVVMVRNMISNHTDMQDKYGDHSNDNHPIQATTAPLAATPPPQERCRGMVVSFVLALNTVNVVAVTTILVFHVGAIGHHVSMTACSLTVSTMRACAHGGPEEPCPQGGGSRWPSHPSPGKRVSLRAKPPNPEITN